MSRTPLSDGTYADPTLSLTSDGNPVFMPRGTVTSYLGTSTGASVKTSAGAVFTITCSNANASILWFQIHNKATAPVLNDVPVRSFPVLANNGFLTLGQDVFGGSGIILTTGVAWGISTARLTYTAATAADAIVTIRWA